MKTETISHQPPVPILTWTITLFCLAITLANQTANRVHIAFWQEMAHFGHVSLAQIWNGNYLALFTSVFVHGTPNSLAITVIHLGFNILFFVRIGAWLEETLSRFHWLLFFITASFVSSGTEIALSSVTSVGISGVLYAMFGLMWSGRRQYPLWREIATRGLMIQLVGWGLFCVLATMIFHWPIANAAHAGGFIYGLAVGWFFTARRRRLMSGLILALLTALTVLSVTWMPWSGTWTAWKADREAKVGHYYNAVKWYRRSAKLGEDPLYIWSNILEMQIHLNNPDGIREAARMLGQSGQNYVEVWQSILLKQMARKNQDGAQQAFEELIRLGAIRIRMPSHPLQQDRTTTPFFSPA